MAIRAPPSILGPVVAPPRSRLTPTQAVHWLALRHLLRPEAEARTIASFPTRSMAADLRRQLGMWHLDSYSVQEAPQILARSQPPLMEIFCWVLAREHMVILPD